MNMIGLILAGGKSRRMGSPKAFLAYKDRTLIELIVSELLSICSQVMIVTNRELFEQMNTLFLPMAKNAQKEQSSFSCDRVSVICDDEKYQNMGPLTGLFTGISNTREHSLYAVVACDMPFLSTSLFLDMALEFVQDSSYDVIMVDNQPLHAIYHQRILAFVEECLLEQSLSLQSLLQKVRVKHVEEFDDREAFTNINTPLEYELLKC